MNRIKVGVMRGGPSSEYGVSLKTGGEVLRHLPERYKGFDILLDKNGDWFLNGFLRKPETILNPLRGGVDVVFNGLHGEFGEDGLVQQIFEAHGAPYTGSAVLPSSLAMKKDMAREIFSRAGIKIPRAMILAADEFFGFDIESCAKLIFNSLPPVWVVKPAAAGSSVGVSICPTFSELKDGLEKAGQYGGKILAEEYIIGREATCGILEDFRGEHYYALPPVEILPPAGHFFDYDVKYNGSTREICPAHFSNDIKRELERVARLAHQLLGCRHYSRADFIVSSKGIFLLEVNTLPGLTAESLLPKAASAAGLEFTQLLDHIIKLALNGG